jgi:hypothetical protein
MRALRSTTTNGRRWPRVRSERLSHFTIAVVIQQRGPQLSTAGDTVETEIKRRMTLSVEHRRKCRGKIPKQEREEAKGGRRREENE